MEKELPWHPLSDLVGRDGIAEVLPPSQRGTQQAQGLPCTRGALQDAVHFLSGAGTGLQGSGVRRSRP